MISSRLVSSVVVVSLSVYLLACAHPAAIGGPAPVAVGRDARELTSIEQARHAVSRLSFGPKTGEVARVASMGVDRWIAMQLEPDRIPDSLATRWVMSLETQRKSTLELIADHPTQQEIQMIQQQAKLPGAMMLTDIDSLNLRRMQQATAQLTQQVGTAKMLRAVASDRELLEVMTDFWDNHFSVFIQKSPNQFSLIEYERDVIRPNALGKFGDLLLAVAKSPQMLFYLDNWQSMVDTTHANVLEAKVAVRRAGSMDPMIRSLATLPRRRGRQGLNENYARELMELHTLGVDGGYSQQDVVNVARALTGWSIENPQFGGGFVFRPEQHDADEKVVLGHTLAAGRGMEDGLEVIAILAKAPATGRFIATKLARRFVQDDPPPALVDRCAKVFGQTNGDIRETLRCVVTSPEFFSRAAYRAKVKTPFELVASSLRAMGADPDTSPRTAQITQRLGQQIFGRLTPDGWPDRGDAWMNSGSILNRINFGFQVAAGQIPGVKLANWAPAVRLRNASIELQVNGVIDELLGGDASAETRQSLLVGSGPGMPGPNQGPALTGLASLVGFALGSPEFQKR